jgi:hypothetical protein
MPALLERLEELRAREQQAREELEEAQGVWRETPATFDEFVEGDAHLNLPPLYERQRAFVREILGDDPAAMFNDPFEAAGEAKRAYQLAVGLWGKGCLLGNMRLTLPDGSRCAISELVEWPDRHLVTAFDEEEGVLRRGVASQPWKAGEGPAYRVTLRTGRVIDAYEGHQLLTRTKAGRLWQSQWEQLRNMREGDPVAPPSHTGLDWLCDRRRFRYLHELTPSTKGASG